MSGGVTGAGCGVDAGWGVTVGMGVCAWGDSLLLLHALTKRNAAARTATPDLQSRLIHQVCMRLSAPYRWGLAATLATEAQPYPGGAGEGVTSGSCWSYRMACPQAKRSTEIGHRRHSSGTRHPTKMRGTLICRCPTPRAPAPPRGYWRPRHEPGSRAGVAGAANLTSGLDIGGCGRLAPHVESSADAEDE